MKVNINDFEPGSTYDISVADWEAPTGELIPGKTLTRRIVEPCSEHNSSFVDGPAPESVIEQWKAFLRVQDPSTGRIHLIHPETIITANVLQ